MREYSTIYEYLSESVKRFIEAQEDIYSDDLSKLYGEGSWLMNFFTFNPKLIADDAMWDTICGMFASETDGNTPFNPALARVYGLFTSLYASGGSKIMNEMIDNTIDSITKLNDPEYRFNRKGKIYNQTKKVFDTFPAMIISTIGNAHFIAKCIRFKRTTPYPRTSEKTR